ncbi:potassium transporter Kup [Polyangium spumosum]|uniref:Probable potassium transport system protein Kup n=1 Tax=Polyangium spumosum TaxID=889282 RepID=A0A6N7PZQ4_9BACT|nr:potassium transporter Kup [Polyangium spumosum]MRG95524.1 potassium transporter Kup [Polyangium spumosum]
MTEDQAGTLPSTPPPASAAPHAAAPHGATSPGARWALLLGALGVVFGDIGTSPLYAIKECFSPASPHRVLPTPDNILGILSLVFWSLLMVVTVKYLTFVLKADNQGSGGILALLALVPTRKGPGTGLLVLLVLLGASLLYGEGVITPAISVLSAMEGLEIVYEPLKPAVVPLTVLILVALFLVQKRGTGGIGSVFGTVTLIWFVTIAALGARWIVANPSVLAAVDPRNAVRFFLEHKSHGFLLLGAVVLCITGCEALYADMGHFGRGPIRRVWFVVVWPALLLNYFGQGAYLLQHPEGATNPFYALAPSWARGPTVAIATAATIVASQALISGAFSLTQQAVQLGYFPRVTIVHTSKDTEGQIYIPEINRALLVACITLVLMFRSSTSLAAAYGIAVTATMTITTMVYFVVVTQRWGWPLWKALPPVAVFLAIDVSFFTANAAKFFHGGWFPVALAAVLFTVMTTWKSGRRILAESFKEGVLPLELFLEDVERTKPHRVRGTAVFMASNPNGTPPVLLHHFKHNQVLHEQVVLLSIMNERVPEIPPEARLSVEHKGHGFYRVTARYGFMQTPHVPSLLAACEEHGLSIELGRASYYLGRETLLPTGRSKMWKWRKDLFAFISRNARPATAYFGLPPGRVVELGMQIDL